MKLRLKLALPSLLGLALAVALIHFYWEPVQLKKARAAFDNHTQELLVSTEAGIIQSLLERDLGSLYSNMEYIEATYQNRWLNLTLYNENNKRIYPLFKANTDTDTSKKALIHINYPLRIEDTMLGHLKLDVNWENEQSITIENLTDIRNMIIWMVFLLMFIAILNQYQVIYKPLKKLIEATNKIKKGDFNTKLPTIRDDEIGKLTSSFSEMSTELAFQKHVVDTHAIVSSTDKNGLITDVNSKFIEITGYSRDELIGKTHKVIKSESQSPEFFSNMWKTITRGTPWHGELCNINKQGEKYWVSASIIPFLGEYGKPERYVSIRTEITKQKQAEQRLKYLADHDTLTGLPMRRVFQEKLVNALALARRNNNKAAVLFIDLDCFKAINDTLGHKFGDLLLVNVAERLSQCIRKVDTVARLGGDEFIIVLTGINNREDVAVIAQKVIDSMSSTFTLSGQTAHIGASVGIALYPDHETDPEMLVKSADDMMYAVKRKGKNNFAFYDDVLEMES